MHKNRDVRGGPESGWLKLLNWAGKLDECP